jgi:hypothetical protein
MAPVVFQPELDASALVARIAGELFAKSAGARALAERLHAVGARLLDAIDVLHLPADAEVRRELAATGFERIGEERAPSGTELWEHPRALLPLVDLGAGTKLRAYVRTDSVTDFLEANAPRRLATVEGAPFAPVRRVLFADAPDAELWLAERRAERFRVSAPELADGPGAAAILRHLEAFRLRPRPLDAPERGFDAALSLARAARAELGDALASELFFEAERSFYTRRNRAARLQKARQDALGFGWFNRDHHTYRSSRVWFRSLVAVLEVLGVRCRERFYAGRDAGWGAQVLEHTETLACVFADVDLSAEEVTGDFPHEGLAARSSLGTVGLWCELHGEAFLAAGMHHLECQFEIEAVTQQFREQGVGVMARFTDFPHLKQAFTEGEIWPVDAARLERAEKAGLLAAAQAERLRREGAIGSHFEVLERNAGYRGFNQEGINRIILATDPRRAAESEPRAAGADRLSSAP